MTAPQTCPCSSGQTYNDCCAPFHRHESLPQTAEQLMRSRYSAYVQDGQETACHHELSAFVKIGNRWYFIDPTTPLPGMKQDCICGSHKKFKACCGRFFK